MIRKDYAFGREARDAIKNVATFLNDTLGKTLGPAGRDYQIPEGVTNDGRSILAHIRFANECEDNVALAFHEIARQIDEQVGDGTTTGTVFGTTLALDLVSQVPDIDMPGGGRSVMDLTRELEAETEKAFELLERAAVPVKTLEHLEQVALTSMEDPVNAKIIAEAMFKAGADSYTAFAEGFSGKIEPVVQAGIEMPLMVAAPFMLNGAKEAVYENVPVLVANHVFDDYRELRTFLANMLEEMKGKNLAFPALVIVGKKFSIPFVEAVARIYNGSKGSINMLLLENAHLADELFEDTAAFVDAKVIDTHPRTGNKITTANFRDCGMVSKIVATSKGAVFYGGKGLALGTGETSRVQARILEIKAQLGNEQDAAKRKAMERRVNEFQGGKVTIYFDAPTVVEKFRLKLKVQDCMNSCTAALKGGIVHGGGVTLASIAEELGPASLLYNALMEPYRRIQRNAGGSLEVSAEVFDAYLVAKAGIECAVSVVKTIIRLEGIIADHPRSLVEDLGAALNPA